MQGRPPLGKEYYSDSLIAKRLDKEEKHRKQIQALQDTLSEIAVNIMLAEINGLPIDDLLQKQAVAQKNLEQEENNQKQLVMMGDIKHSTKPIRVFSEKEMQQIQSHYEKLPGHLQKLMDAALADDAFSLGLCAQPVFIKGEGNIYDDIELKKMLKQSKEPLTLYSRKPFDASQIIPCNTLLRAMEDLLNVIQKKEVKPIDVSHKLLSLSKGQTRKRIPVELVLVIEKYYLTMEDKHKHLFNTICRDPVTKVVMDDPVFLPDGNVYDRSTVLDHIKEGDFWCPLNPEISFTKDDITPCQMVVRVLDALKEIIQENVKKMSQQAADKAPAPAMR